MANRRAKTHGPTSKRVAHNVRRLRQQQGLTRKDLADRSRGWLSVDVVQKIENGAADPAEGRVVRQVNVDDLMVLSIALGVAPGTLLFPDDVRGETEVTGAGTVPGLDAWEWYRLQRPLELSEDHAEAVRQSWLFRAMAMPAGLAPVPDDYQETYARQQHQDIVSKVLPRKDKHGDGPD